MRVLIVENDMLAAARLKKTLLGWGYAVDMVTSAHDGLTFFQRSALDVVLIALPLPDMLETELIAQFKNFRHTVGIIVMSDDLSRDVEIRIREQGILNYMLKPLDVVALHRILDHLATKRSVEKKGESIC